MPAEELFDAERKRMIEEQLVERGIRNERVLKAMEAVPRHAFILPEYRIHAYEDGPLPIGNGQTISQPYIVALMSELLELRGGESVLEIGTGSGYQAAVLAHLAQEVHTVERHVELTYYARRILGDLGLTNVHFHVGDGSLGWPENAPYGGIIVTAAAPDVPKTLLEQLADGGRLVIPIGNRARQELEVWSRLGDRYEFDTIIPVAFVPLLGEKGWKDEEQFSA
jgi:protein-L-isoaspartate(D-aspartate) O-methyltransferase